jgi:hypothetical protein
MPSADINYLAVLVAAILSMVIGAVWYSPGVLGKQWMKLVGKKQKDLQKGANTAYAVATIGFLLLAYVLAHFVDYTGATTVASGLQVGYWVWLGFVAPTAAISTAFSQKPRQLWLIDVGYYLVALLVSGALLAVWR